VVELSTALSFAIAASSTEAIAKQKYPSEYPEPISEKSLAANRADAQ
jgi:hypothetical protein